MSYWFVSFSLFYNDSQKGVVEVKGNSVHELNTKTFMPGCVIKKISQGIEEEKAKKGSVITDSWVLLHSVVEIDEHGFADFLEPAQLVEKWSISGRDFYTTSRTAVQIIR